MVESYIPEHYQELTTSMTKEVWKTIKEYPDYKVSNYGRVMNNNTGRILKPLTGAKYYRVYLYKDHKGKSISIHRLVASYFLSNPYPHTLEYINHIDEDKHNNRADNLEWCSAKYNYNWSKDRAIQGAIDSSIARGKTRPIVVYDIYKQKAIEYPSTREVERELDLPSGNMAPVLQERGKHVLMARKYMLFYKQDWNYENLKNRFNTMENSYRTPKKVEAFNLDSGELLEFDSMREASKKLGFPHQAISRCLNENQLSTHGYKFRWGKLPKLPGKLPKLS